MKAILTEKHFGILRHKTKFDARLGDDFITITIDSSKNYFRDLNSDFEIELVIKENPKQTITTEFK